MCILIQPLNTKIGYKYTQSNQKHSQLRFMASDFGQHNAYIPLAKLAFAEHAYVPKEATLQAAAKNLARLETLAAPVDTPLTRAHFDAMLKRLSHA